MAPPKKMPEGLRGSVTLRLSVLEKSAIADDAKAAGLTLSELIRRRYFGRKVTASADREIIRELRRAGGLMKAVHVESGGAYSDLTADALVKIGSLIDQISARMAEGD